MGLCFTSVSMRSLRLWVLFSVPSVGSFSVRHYLASRLLVINTHLDNGSIRASTVLYQRLLETVLFANIRFHDTISRGRLLNRFGKDFEGIDSNLSDNFGRSAMYGLSALTTLATITFVGGAPFLAATLVLGVLYFNCKFIPSLSINYLILCVQPQRCMARHPAICAVWIL